MFNKIFELFEFYRNYLETSLPRNFWKINRLLYSAMQQNGHLTSDRTFLTGVRRGGPQWPYIQTILYHLRLSSMKYTLCKNKAKYILLLDTLLQPMLYIPSLNLITFSPHTNTNLHTWLLGYSHLQFTVSSENQITPRLRFVWLITIVCIRVNFWHILYLLSWFYT